MLASMATKCNYLIAAMCGIDCEAAVDGVLKWFGSGAINVRWLLRRIIIFCIRLEQLARLILGF